MLAVPVLSCLVTARPLLLNLDPSVLSFDSCNAFLQGKLYLLLLGTTALSLVTTPLLFKMIPAVVHLGVLLRWFSVDSNQVELGLKGEVLRIDSGKRINLIIQGPHDS